MKLFSRVQIPGLEFRHKEDAYVDLNRERLIPHNLSAEGPALAVGDVNGDGLEDLVCGRGNRSGSHVFTQQNDGSFHAVACASFYEDRLTEDVDAAFFDADGDGDPDLYIVRGGNEVPIRKSLAGRQTAYQ